MIKRPGRAALLGLLFVTISLIYGALSHDWGGTTLLLALGLAMGLMAWVLVAGSPRGDENT